MPAFFAVLRPCVLRADAAPLEFNRDVRPVLSDKCFACHGFDAKKRKAGLRLDVPEAPSTAGEAAGVAGVAGVAGAYGKGESGELAVVPGNPDASALWKRIITADRDELMPPPKSHKTLSASEKETLRRWISEGAKYQKHWAFEAPVQPVVPPLPQGVEGGALDAFLLKRLSAEKFAYKPRASKETLVRRVTLALTGLPPSMAEVDAFLADSSPDAYPKLVDRLLASPHFGEQMARHWLDVARYGDTHGLHLDNERSMWPYRDWVVGAFNRNLSFRDFTIEQIAGDLLPSPTNDQLVATGFNRCNVTTSEGGAIAAEFTYRYAVDRTATMAQTWMGLTAGCAVCHDHKFDPISQREFYELYAFYNVSADPAMDGNALLTAPVVKLSTPEQAARLKDLEGRIAKAGTELQAQIAKLDYSDPAKASPPILPQEETLPLFDDDFPAGAKVQSSPADVKPVWVTKDNGPVCSGQRSLKVSGKAVAQNFYQSGAAPFEVPPCARLSMMVFLDPAEPPTAVMLQIHTDQWKHRALWGDLQAINYGTADTTTRFGAGALPQPGNWAQLEVDVTKLGLKAGDQVLGFAFTLHGGTAYFDQLQMVGRVDAANDPRKSLEVWIKAHKGKDTQGLPPEINKLHKVAEDKRTPDQQRQLREYFLGSVCSTTKQTLGPLQDAERKLRKEREEIDAAIPASFIMRDMDKPRESFVMQRGAYDKPGEKVAPRVPAILPPLAAAVPEAPTRLDLARWLVSDSHPLTARVTVNRFWQQFFGVGLVRSSGDFGSQGESPSHPELLDWLAIRFRESGWDVKALVKLFVTSSAYQQEAAAAPALWSRDPENRLLARGPRFRLDAEELRDQALAVSGLLRRELGGKGVRIYQPENIWEPVGFVGSNTRFYKADSGPALYRRSLYTFLKRTAPPPLMANFDGPSREQSCMRRERSNTPLQALQLMNDVQFFEAARAFAERILSEAGPSAGERIEFAFRTALARRPEPAEAALVKAALDRHAAGYQQNPAAAGRMIRTGESQPRTGLQEPELAAWTLVANLVLNLDEALNLQ